MPGALPPLESLVGDRARATPGADRRVAAEFEALLTAEVWKSAGRGLGLTHPLSGGPAGRMYQELFLDHVMRGAAPGPIAGAIEDHLARQPVEGRKEPR